MPIDPLVLLTGVATWDQRAGAVAAPEPLECVVRALFADGSEHEVAATASAWSREAVLVYFPHPVVPGPAYRVWVPADRVRRLPPADVDEDTTERPPHG